MDASEPRSPLPQLPPNLDDPAALDKWYCAWNAWIADEAGRRHWSWLKPITPETLREIVEGEKQLRADIVHGRQQIELNTARSDLNALEANLRATDPQYETKCALLVSILQPIFRHVPHSNWKALFEQAYAQLQSPAGLRLSADDTKPRLAASTSEQRPMRGGEEKRNADSKPLDWKSMQCIEQECGTYWAKDLENWNRVYVEEELDRRVLPELRQKAISDCLTEEQYRDGVALAWMVTKNLFYALHYDARASWQGYDSIASGPAKPKFFWLHQGLDFLRIHDKSRGFAISKDDLSISAANYVKHSEVRTNHLDWLYLDSTIFYTLEVLAEEIFVRRMGTGINWAAVFARGNAGRYVSLLILFGVLRFAAAYVSGPAAAYWLHRYGHDVAAMWAVGLWGAAVVFGWITYPLRGRARRKGQRLLTHLTELNRTLADRIISPRKLREKLDLAAADGIVVDGAVTAIVDRMVARDPAAFIHLV